MTFREILQDVDLNRLRCIINQASVTDVRAGLAQKKLQFEDYLLLLSPAASEIIEELAIKARELTLHHFGRTILLYAPLYLSNECDNRCVYCGFSQKLPEKRVTLSPEEAVLEAEVIYRKGFRHLLLVSGEKRAVSDCVICNSCYNGPKFSPGWGSSGKILKTGCACKKYGSRFPWLSWLSSICWPAPGTFPGGLCIHWWKR